MNLGILDGVTTNPSLMAKEGIKGEDAVMNIIKPSVKWWMEISALK